MFFYKFLFVFMSDITMVGWCVTSFGEISGYFQVRVTDIEIISQNNM